MNLALGGLLAVSAHRQLMGARSAIANRWFRDALIFGTLIMLPTGIFFYLQWPEWSWLYYVDPASVGTAATVAVWLAYPVSVALGFALAAVLVRGDTPRMGLAVPAFGGVLLAVVTALAFSRFITLTNYDEFNNILLRMRGGMPYIWSDKIWIATMAGTGLFAGIPFTYLILRNIREGGGLLPPVKP